MDALDVAEVLQRLQYNNHHNRCAVRIGNNATGTLQGILCITLGHNQGYVIVHTESA